MVCCYYDFFSMLILYPANILNLFTNSNRYLSEYLRISIYNILSSTNGDNFTSSLFLSNLNAFYVSVLPNVFLHCFAWNGENGHPCELPDFKEKLSDFHLWVRCYLWACHVWFLLCWTCCLVVHLCSAFSWPCGL